MKPSAIHREPKRTRTRATPQAGFLLLEVLVAMLLFSFGVLGMIRMQAQAVRFSVDASERTHAALMANDLVAVMWASQSVTPNAAQYAAWTSRLNTESISGLRDASATIGTPDANGVVLITITWTSIARDNGRATGVYVTEFVVPGVS